MIALEVANDAQEFQHVDSAAGVLDALVRSGFKTTAQNRAECPVCRSGLSLTVRKGIRRVELTCTAGCAETEIAGRLCIDLGAVRDGSRTSSNHGTAPGSEALRAEPVREPVRARAEIKKLRTTLPSPELLDDFLERTASLPDPEWLVPELVPDAGRVHFAAAPNAGKTFLCLVVAKFAAEQDRVVYMVLEEGLAKSTGNRFRDLRFPPGLKVLVWHNRGINLGDHAGELAAMLERAPPPRPGNGGRSVCERLPRRRERHAAGACRHGDAQHAHAC
ncbi:MAG: AAA family ATPase [Archangiaceae bacterium]|nr:AAA family ATPase [Archangiaceae bacterium]